MVWTISGRFQINTPGGANYRGNSRLTAPHHAGTSVLHVDNAWDDPNDNINQPLFLGWHAGIHTRGWKYF